MLESLGEAQQVMGAQRVVALELDFRLFPGFELVCGSAAIPQMFIPRGRKD